MPDSALPSPEQIALYAKSGEDLPLAIIAARTEALRMEYRYAVADLAIGGLGLIAVVGGFIFLVMYNHPQACLGLAILGLISAFGKARLPSRVSRGR